MAYNLPPAWDPGYALPSNVRAEGLQRRAFVTKWMQRGTYNYTPVGAAGYAVPQYVKDEAYGRGTFTTDWPPSGTYAGPKVPHWLNQRSAPVAQRQTPAGTAVTFRTASALGDTDAPVPLEVQAYGQQVAATILRQVSTLPKGQRKAQLQKIMMKIDPSLWSSTAAIATAEVAAGAAPAAALYTALSQTLAQGFAKNLVKVGKRGQLSGMGCAPCMMISGGLGDAVAPGPGNYIRTTAPGALGSVLPSSALRNVAGDVGPIASSVSAAGAGVGTAIPEGSLTSDGKLRWSYHVNPQGAWHVVAPGETGPKTTIDSAPILAASSKQQVYVGPFALSADVLQNSNWQLLGFGVPSQLPPAWRAWLTNVLAAGSPCPTFDRPILTPGGKGATEPAWKLIPNVSTAFAGKDTSGNACHFIQYTNDPKTYQFYDPCDWWASIKPGGWTPCLASPLSNNSSILSATAGKGCVSLDYLPYVFHQFDSWFGDMTTNPGGSSDAQNAIQALPPVAKFVHPITGKTWGMWVGITDAMTIQANNGQTDTYTPTIGLGGLGYWVASNNKPNSASLVVGLRELPEEPWFDQILGAFVQALMFIPSLLGDIVGVVVSAVGDLGCALASSGALNKAGGIVGAGASIAGALCSGAPPPACPPGMQYDASKKECVKPFPILPVAIGAGLLAVLVATRKRDER